MRTPSETGIQTSVLATKPEESDHPFVNNVRFWSMMAIIAVHSLCAWGFSPNPGLARDMQMGLLQLVKFGTIGFYLISGFLLGERLPHSSAMKYLLRRVRTVGRPWAFWAAAFLCLFFAQLTLQSPTLLHQLTPADIWLFPSIVILYTPYWFVPNFVVALGLLLVFRRLLNDLRFGGILLAISILYGVNAYCQWIPGGHTTAVFGFLFYLWLGNWASRNFEKISNLLERVNYPTLLGAIAASCMLAMLESRHLVTAASTNPEGAFNTLRISNQVFSILTVLAFLKCRRVLTPTFVNVRTTTFGQYLLHPICILVFQHLLDCGREALVKGISGHGKAPEFWTNPGLAFCSWATLFITVYGTSLVVAMRLSVHPRFGWVVGQRTGSGKRAPVTMSVAPQMTPVAA